MPPHTLSRGGDEPVSLPPALRQLLPRSAAEVDKAAAVSASASAKPLVRESDAGIGEEVTPTPGLTSSTAASASAAVEAVEETAAAQRVAAGDAVGAAAVAVAASAAVVPSALRGHGSSRSDACLALGQAELAAVSRPPRIPCERHSNPPHQQQQQQQQQQRQLAGERRAAAAAAAAAAATARVAATPAVTPTAASAKQSPAGVPTSSSPPPALALAAPPSPCPLALFSSPAIARLPTVSSLRDGPPPLFALCLDVVADNIAHATSLRGVPEDIALALFRLVLGRGKLTERVLKLFLDMGHEQLLSYIRALGIRTTVIRPVLPTRCSMRGGL